LAIHNSPVLQGSWSGELNSLRLRSAPKIAQKDVCNEIESSDIGGDSSYFLASTMAVAAEEPSEQVKRMDAAATVLDEIMGTPDKGIPEELLNSAKCVAVIPSMIKIGFVFGGRHGRGLPTCRTHNSPFAENCVLFRCLKIGVHSTAPSAQQTATLAFPDKTS
jgi:hypothetical protein